MQRIPDGPNEPPALSPALGLVHVQDCGGPTVTSGTAASSAGFAVVLHLHDAAAVTFESGALWPLTGAYSRFGTDLDSLAAEVARRLHEDGYLAYRPTPDSVGIIPVASIKRVDVTPG